MSSTLVLLHFIQEIMTPPQSYYLVNALLIVAAFAFSFIVFRSYIYSYTLAICLGFGTQYYHLYNIPTVVSFYLYTIYVLALFLCLYKFITTNKRKWVWFGFFVLSLFLTAISYEGWLDVFVYLMLASVFVFFLLTKFKEPEKRKRLILLAAIILVTAAAYMIIKVQYGYGQSAGAESDVVWNYLPEKSLIFWDMASNYVTLFYMGVSNFLPSFFIVPWDMIKYGDAGLIAMQNGYHPAGTHLVPMNMLFFWRYFAGIFLTVFVYAIAKVIRICFQKDSPRRADAIAIAVFLIMIATAGPTHMIVKFRPMHSLAFLNYQVVVGVIGVSMLISYLLMMLEKRTTKKWLLLLVVTATWVFLFYITLTKPATIDFATQYLLQSEGRIPDPLVTLQALFLLK